MKYLLISALLFYAGLTAGCSEAATGVTSSMANTPALLPATPPTPAPRYDVRGIFDPGLGGLIAYALKVPHGWLLQQSLTRVWDRHMPIDQLFLSLTSPDKHEAFTLLPQTTYSFDNSPGAAQIAAFMAQSGHTDPSKLAPLLPVAYLKQVVLPRLNQQAATRVRLTGEQETPPKATGQNTQYASGYVDGVLPSGRKVRLNTEIMLYLLNLNGNTSGNWTVLTTITESDTNLAAAVTKVEQIAKSVISNPAWQRQDADLQQRGAQANIEESKSQIQAGLAANQARLEANYQRFQQNVTHQQAQRNALSNNFQRQQRASSQSASAFADYMGDKTLYQNPNTGERFKVQGSLGHVYQNAQAGTVLNTNQPLNPTQVNWQELQQVELKNY